jgi:hypothetical protein
MNTCIGHLSKEQEEAIELARDGHNIIVNAVAGGGKTTFAIHLMRQFRDVANVIFMTYNNKLCKETRAKYNNICDNNASANDDNGITFDYFQRREPERIFTFHGLCNQLIRCDDAFRGLVCKNDVILENAIRANVPRIHIGNFVCTSQRRERNLIIIDEAQDLTELLFSFIAQVYCGLVATGYETQIVIIGDKYQCIYEWNGADSRYLTEISAILDAPFINCALSHTFRCMPSVVSFVNDCAHEEARMNVAQCKASINTPIDYIVTNPNNDAFAEFIYNIVIKYGQENVTIITPTVISTSYKCWEPLESYLSSYNVAINKMRSDSEFGVTVANGALTICTFHQSKGTENDVIIILGLDSDYTSYIAKDESPEEFSNIEYVALTRAKTRLIIVQRNTCAPLPIFVPLLTMRDDDDVPLINAARVNMIVMNECANVVQHCALPYKPAPITITRAARNAHRDAHKYIAEHERTTLPILRRRRTDSRLIILTHKTECFSNRAIVEEVSDINGNIITLLYDSKLTGGSYRDEIKTRYDRISKLIDLTCRKDNTESIKISNSGINILNAFNNDLKSEIIEFNRITTLNKHDLFKRALPIYARIAAAYSVLKGGANFYRLRQITKWDWLINEDTKIQEIMTRMSRRIVNDGRSEVHCYFDHFGTKARRLVGIADFLTGRIIYEIKCTQEITTDHVIQVLLYARALSDDKRECHDNVTGNYIARYCRVYNPLSDETWTIYPTSLAVWAEYKSNPHQLCCQIIHNLTEFIDKTLQENEIIIRTREEFIAAARALCAPTTIELNAGANASVDVNNTTVNAKKSADSISYDITGSDTSASCSYTSGGDDDDDSDKKE